MTSAKNCKMFACVYAGRDKCHINGYLDDEGPLNGTKSHCKHFDVMCVSVKCESCMRDSSECCS